MDEEYEWNGSVFTPRNTSKGLSLVINKNFDCANVAIELAFSLSKDSRKLGATKED